MVTRQILDEMSLEDVQEWIHRHLDRKAYNPVAELCRPAWNALIAGVRPHIKAYQERVANLNEAEREIEWAAFLAVIRPYQEAYGRALRTAVADLLALPA